MVSCSSGKKDKDSARFGSCVSAIKDKKTVITRGGLKFPMTFRKADTK